MTFVNCGWIGVQPGRAADFVAHLTAPSAELAEVGCLQYDVGTNADEPDRVYVVERWTSAQAHQDSLQLASVQAAIAAARPLMSGEVGGFDFHVAGSPLNE
ncbi:putative quinol monooxygenase [Nocardioides sambongensis]|uniref:putative quinol monooxygenase n=1 Tax=Nocardioides sambongensis TaxID=2589074 RepID=UPI00112E7380|nr:antibiotic biosynthesis monooxygenase [Nocardioides sambongensis]